MGSGHISPVRGRLKITEIAQDGTQSWVDGTTRLVPSGMAGYNLVCGLGSLSLARSIQVWKIRNPVSPYLVRRPRNPAHVPRKSLSNNDVSARALHDSPGSTATQKCRYPRCSHSNRNPGLPR